MSNSAKGLKLAFIAALISGFSIFINKFAVSSLDSPILLTTLKNLSVGFLFTSLLIISGKWQKVKLLTKKELGQLVVIGVVGGSLSFYLFFTGLSQIPAINANIIHKSLVIWVAFLAVPILKEKPTFIQGLSVLLLFGSNLIIGGFKGFGFSNGELLILLATILWAAETILVKKVLTNIDSGIAATFRMGLGSVVLLAYSFVTNPSELIMIGKFSSTQWFWIGLTSLALFGYVSFWYKSLKFTSAINVSAVLVLSTLITNFLSAVFITHTWNPVLTYQGILIVIGILLIAYKDLSTSSVQKDNFSIS